MLFLCPVRVGENVLRERAPLFMIRLFRHYVPRGLLLLAMVPGFLGLLVVLPVLGHASWHVYAGLRDLAAPGNQPLA